MRTRLGSGFRVWNDVSCSKADVLLSTRCVSYCSSVANPHPHGMNVAVGDVPALKLERVHRLDCCARQLLAAVSIKERVSYYHSVTKLHLVCERVAVGDGRLNLNSLNSSKEDS